jgi:hypothetical protein
MARNEADRFASCLRRADVGQILSGIPAFRAERSAYDCVDELDATCPAECQGIS